MITTIFKCDSIFAERHIQVQNPLNSCFIFQTLSARWQRNQKMRVNFIHLLCVCTFLHGPPLLEAQPTTIEEEDTCSSLQTMLFKEEILLLKEQFAAISHQLGDSLIVQKEMLKHIHELSHARNDSGQRLNDSLMVQKEMLKHIDRLSNDSHDNARKLNDSLMVQKEMLKNIDRLSNDSHDNARKSNDSLMVQKEMLKNMDRLSNDSHDNARKLNDSLMVQKEMLKNIDRLSNDSHDNARKSNDSLIVQKEMLKNIHDSHDSIQKLNGSLRDLRKSLGNLPISLINPLACFVKPVPIDIPYCTAGWLIIQRRMDGSVDFYRGWSDYRQGFGVPSGEFWIGLETMHSLTQSRTYKLRIDLEDFDENTRYAEYSTFAISDEAHGYTLSIGTYSGTAGDSLTWHNHRPFLTKDHTGTGRPAPCPVKYKGDWWYYDCSHSNLNGLYLRAFHTSYADGVNWYHWRGDYYSLKTSIMMIKPVG